MNYHESLDQLQRFAREVKDYYDRSKHLSSGSIVISHQMAALALPRLSATELHAFICELEKNGYVTVLAKEPLSFTPDFLTR
jgi:hypothetical protein